ncbi:hypothetical protein [Campylobacter troglodytis]|uniref:hypothetical protein n=1 Tax=Campylobacter troglodytis TaxID=654363 RepID=UPI001159EEFB|nr:hypothetical protein [Campylobacter troglodytis]
MGRIAMAFMNFECFLYARSKLSFVLISDLSVKKSGKYFVYEFYAKILKNKHSIKEDILKEKNSATNTLKHSTKQDLKETTKPKSSLLNSDQDSQKLGELGQDLQKSLSLENSQETQGLLQKKFSYTALNEGLFSKNDELILMLLKEKIILFRNLTKDIDNFKEARLRHMVLSLLFFCASAVFGVFCFQNDFLLIDLAFFSLFFLGFLALLVNFNALKRQISILNKIDKKEFTSYAQEA